MINEFCSNENKMAAIIGVTSGLLKFFHEMDKDNFIQRLFEAIIIAFLCAIAGVAAKYIAEAFVLLVKNMFLGIFKLYKIQKNKKNIKI